MEEQHYSSERERAIIERALANKQLMDAVRESIADEQRGVPPIPGRLVQEEARARDASVQP